MIDVQCESTPKLMVMVYKICQFLIFILKFIIRFIIYRFRTSKDVEQNSLYYFSAEIHVGKIR